MTFKINARHTHHLIEKKKKQPMGSGSNCPHPRPPHPAPFPGISCRWWRAGNKRGLRPRHDYEGSRLLFRPPRAQGSCVSKCTRRGELEDQEPVQKEPAMKRRLPAVAVLSTKRSHM